jgi:hypothetical protein
MSSKLGLFTSLLNRPRKRNKAGDALPKAASDENPLPTASSSQQQEERYGLQVLYDGIEMFALDPFPPEEDGRYCRST